jgi:hypothetical protein
MLSEYLRVDQPVLNNLADNVIGGKLLAPSPLLSEKPLLLTKDYDCSQGFRVPGYRGFVPGKTGD